MDQRKVNMLAREYCDDARQKIKPVVLSHTMLPGLLQGQEKMSKSDPDSSIWMEDSATEVNRKIKKSYCPPGEIAANPCVKYVDLLVFPHFGEFNVERKEKHGGNILFKTVEEFHKSYTNNELHPLDLKTNLAKCLNTMIEPVRKHFEEDPAAKALVEEIRRFEVTK